MKTRDSKTSLHEFKISRADNINDTNHEITKTLLEKYKPKVYPIERIRNSEDKKRVAWNYE